MKGKSKKFKIGVSVIVICAILLLGSVTVQAVYHFKIKNNQASSNIFNTTDKILNKITEISSKSTTKEQDTTTETTKPTTSETTGVTETSSEVSTTTVIDPLKFSKSDLIKFVNNASNRVRHEKPGFTYIEDTKISNLKIGKTEKMSLATKIISYFFPDHKITVEKGSKNAPLEDYALTSYFGSEQGDWAINFRDEDIKSAKISEENGMYRVDLKLIEEINPEKNGQSAYSRGILIMTVDDVLRIANENGDGLFNAKLSVNVADKNDIKLRYHDGFISVLIDKEGKIREMKSQMKIDASGKEVSVKVGAVQLIAVKEVSVTIEKNYKQVDFVW